jgi:hypothetical protein
VADSPIQRACRGTGGVLIILNPGLADPVVRGVFVDALRTGRLLDAAAAELRLSALVVVVAGTIRPQSTSQVIGFRSAREREDTALGEIESDLRKVVDVVARPVSQAEERMAAEWIHQVAVPRVAALLKERGLELRGAELVDRLGVALGGSCSLAAVDRWVEHMLLPELLDLGPTTAEPRRSTGR